MTVRAVLFDLGGVLAALRGEAHLLPLLDGRMDRAEMWRRWGASPAVRLHETGACDAMAFCEAIVPELGLCCSPAQFHSEFSRWIIGPFPETAELLSRAKDRYTTALLTNTSALHWPVIEGLGVLPAMDHVFASFRMGLLKPDRDYFAHVVEAMGIDPGEAVFFDDSAANVATAAAMGMRAHRVEGAGEALAVLVREGLV